VSVQNAGEEVRDVIAVWVISSAVTPVTLANVAISPDSPFGEANVVYGAGSTQVGEAVDVQCTTRGGSGSQAVRVSIDYYYSR
jgi:hypothetical protein